MPHISNVILRRSVALLLLAACASPRSSTVAGPSPKPLPESSAPRAGASTGRQRAESFKALPLPVWPEFDVAVAKGTRTATGEPGPNYWQQRASYVLRAELNPVSKRLSGSGTITYQNASPDALPVLYIQAYPNLFAPDAKRNTNILAALGGITFTKVSVAGTALDSTAAAGAGYTVNGTVMALRLPAPLEPGGSLELGFEWSLRVAPDGPRGGQDRETYVLSYWYPQVAVYDDVNGWQADQYLGNAEFYMGYADYDVALTVPAGWLVTSTGVLTNPEDVLSAQTRARLDEARARGTVVNVVKEADRGAGKSTTEGADGRLTWRYRASNVRDVTWATSNLYLWDVTTTDVGDVTGDGKPDSTLIGSYYRPDRIRNGWRESARYAARAISVFSKALWPYPYPHMSVVDGPASCGGMEYPMITCIGGDWNPRTLFDVEAHEIAHMWFPMMVGSDEKRHAWMDEGFAQYLQAAAIKVEFPTADDEAESRRNYLEAMRYLGETELMRHGDMYPNYTEYGVASYFKPATALVALRTVIGDSTLARGLREYGRRWSGKHPMPPDFWNTISGVAGQDLDWFWRSWFYETWKLDQAIDDAVQVGDSLDVQVENKGRMPMPVILVARNQKGDTTQVMIPVDVWLTGTKRATVRMAVPSGFTRVEIDPDERFPDVDRTNQVWPRR
jgi:hypothetical protein